METIINLGIWENKNYHFDWENKVLLEETSSPNYWSYILLPVTLYIINKISDILAEAGIFNNQLVRVGTVTILGVLSYFLAALIIKFYHGTLKLKKSELDGEQSKKFVRSLKRRRGYFKCLLNFFRILTVVATLLFVFGNETIAVLFLAVSFLVIFMFKFDYQLNRWFEIIKIVEKGEKNV